MLAGVAVNEMTHLPHREFCSVGEIYQVVSYELVMCTLEWYNSVCSS